MISRRSLTLCVSSVYLFLYLPIIILVFFSFNNATSSYHWVGFTMKAYAQLLHSQEIWLALKNSLIVATSAMFLSIIFGTMVVYGARKYLDKISHLFYIPILVPEIIISVGFLYFFFAFKIPLGIPSLIVAHTLLGLALTVPLLHTRLSEMSPDIVEASLDLGASEWQTFRRIIIPHLTPAIFAAGLLAWIISFDDFLISFFCAGSLQTLPLYIYARVRVGVSPVINAISTLTLITSVLLVWAHSWFTIKSQQTESA